MGGGGGTEAIPYPKKMGRVNFSESWVTPGLFFARFQKTQGHLQKNSSQLFAENSMSWRQLMMLRKKTQGIFKGTQ